MKQFDAERAWNEIKALDYPRLPNTPGEDRARDELASRFRGLGFETWIHAFRYSTGGMTKFLPAAMLTLAALLSLCLAAYWTKSRWLAAPVGLFWIVFIALIRINESDIPLLLFKPRNVGFNIMTRVPSQRGRGRVVFMAHYDTKSQIMPVHIRVTMYVLGLLMLIVLMVVYLIMAVSLINSSHESAPNLILIAFSLVAIIDLLILAVNPPLNGSAGAMDDASGIAVMLELGRCLEGKALRNVDVWLVATDCEEVGLLGALYFSRELKHDLPLDNTWIINLDMPVTASGAVSLNTSHGIPPKPTSRKLNALINEIAADKNIKLKHLPIPIGAAADHFPFLRAGYEATGFISASTVVHTPLDTADRVPAAPLGMVGEICLEAVKRLDAGLG